MLKGSTTGSSFPFLQIQIEHHSSFEMGSSTGAGRIQGGDWPWRIWESVERRIQRVTWNRGVLRVQSYDCGLQRGPGCCR